jgi:4-carboxymuconolactone decarboxylase
MAEDRMPPIPESALTEAQRKASAAFAAERGRPPFGPFVAILRSPELMLRAAAMGEYLRYRNALPRRLSELAILIVSRLWTQQFEWHHHLPDAIKAGLDPATAQAIAEGRRPEPMAADEAIVYEFALELERNRSVSDATYARARERLGEQGVIDLIGICGYYGLLGMVMNVARTPLPGGTRPPLKPFPA